MRIAKLYLPALLGLAVTTGAAPSTAASAWARSASAPSASTGGVTNLAPVSVRLTGTVNPGGSSTTYYFQYATTSHYAKTSSGASAGAGHSKVGVVADVTGLAPATRYHYRLVAVNRHGTARGADRTFTTPRIPLSLGIAASPNPVRYAGVTAVLGTLAGTGNANREVILQADPFPYTAGFVNVGNPELTNSNGGFVFPVLGLTTNTQFRVVSSGKPTVYSPVVFALVAVQVRARVSVHRLRGRRRGARVRFFGSITPVEDGALVSIQKRIGRRWVTLGETSARHASRTSSGFGRTVRLHRGGVFRVLVHINDGAHVSNVSDSLRVSAR